MSDLEKLQIVINQLNNINVPTVLLEQVIIPIRNSAIVLEGIYKNLSEKTAKDEVTVTPIASVPIEE